MAVQPNFPAMVASLNSLATETSLIPNLPALAGANQMQADITLLINTVNNNHNTTVAAFANINAQLGNINTL